MREIYENVSDHSIGLGRDVVTDDLILLALSELDRRQPAWLALTASGVPGSEELFEEIRVEGDGGWPTGTIRWAPSYYVIRLLQPKFGRTLGTGIAAPEHVLLALLWTPSSHTRRLLAQLTINPETIVRNLREVGVTVPGEPVPELLDVSGGPRVWIDRARLGDVVDHIARHTDPAMRWTFGYEGAGGWVQSDKADDLEALVTAAPAMHVPHADDRPARARCGDYRNSQAPGRALIGRLAADRDDLQREGVELMQSGGLFPVDLEEHPDIGPAIVIATVAAPSRAHAQEVLARRYGNSVYTDYYGPTQNDPEPQ